MTSFLCYDLFKVVLATYKVIVSDLDRTLLNNNGGLTDYTVNILNQCKALGYKLIFATARPKRDVLHFLEKIEVDALVVHNGASIYIDNQLIESYGIDQNTLNKVKETVYKIRDGYGISIEMNDTNYSNIDVSSLWPLTKFELSDLNQLPEGKIDKIIVHIENQADVNFIEERLDEDLYFQMSEGIIGLIMHKDASKLKAIMALSDLFRFRLDEVIAFGDDLNDLSLIEACGKGIAMNNGLDIVKEVANGVCLSNQEDGVAKWLERNILGR